MRSSKARKKGSSQETVQNCCRKSPKGTSSGKEDEDEFHDSFAASPLIDVRHQR
jgi:hypothetical protein